MSNDEILVGQLNSGGTISLTDSTTNTSGNITIRGGSGLGSGYDSGYIEITTQYGADGINEDGLRHGSSSGNVGISTTTGGNGVFGGRGGESGAISFVISNGGQGGNNNSPTGNGGHAGSLMLSGGNGGNGHVGGNGTSILLYAGNGGQGNQGGNGGDILFQSGVMGSGTNAGTSGQIIFNLTPMMGPKSGLSGTFGKFDYNGNFVTMAGIADQGYQLISVSSGFNITLDDNMSTYIITSGSTLSSGTIVFPNNVIDGQRLTLLSIHPISTISIQCQTGQNVLNAPTLLSSGVSVSYIYVSTISSWCRLW